MIPLALLVPFAPPVQRRHRYLVCLVLVCILLPYLPGTAGPFIWDDRPLILSEAIRTPHPFFSYFVSPFWRPSGAAPGTVNFYRPLTTLSYVMDFWIHGENPVGFHLTNLVFHLGNCGLLYGVLVRLGSRKGLAALCTLLWGLFPRLTECVTWISGRTDVLASTGLLLCLLFWLHKKSTMASLALLWGLFCKEVCVALVPALCLYEFCRHREGGAGLKEALRKASRALWPLWIPLLIYLPLRTYALSLVEVAPAPITLLPASVRVLQILEAIGWYTAMVVNPFQPRTQIGLIGQVNGTVSVLGGTVLVLGLVFGLRVVAKLKAERILALALAASSVFLVLHVIPIPVDVTAADRFLYVPLLGMALFAGPALSAFCNKESYKATLLSLPLCALALGFVTAVYDRNLDWSDEVRFWVDARATSQKENGRPSLELANVYYRAALFQDALQLYQEAVDRGRLSSLSGPVQSALSNQANSLSQLGRYEEAKVIRSWLLAHQPNVPKYHHDLALLELHRENFAEAREAVGRALSLFPGYREAAQLLAQIDLLERAGPPQTPLVLAQRLTQMGRRPEAERAWLVVVQSPDSSVADLRQAVSYLSIFGDLRGAFLAYRRFVEVGGPQGQKEAGEMHLVLTERADLERRLILSRPRRVN